MYKSTMIKWAVAALLAVPAASAIATPLSHKHKPLIRHHRHSTVSALVATRHQHRSLHGKSHKHVALSSLRHRHHSSVSMSSGLTHRTVNITHIPPTIDGMHT